MSIIELIEKIWNSIFHKPAIIGKGDSTKKAVCIGINKYKTPANKLNGCVNDATEWKSLLSTTFNFGSVVILLNEMATKPAILNAVRKLISEAKNGDKLVITYSGHGSSIMDKEGDEDDGRDETWVSVEEDNITDDELREAIGHLPAGAKLTVISDSCHSGSVTRDFMQTMNAANPPRPRYLPPKDNKDVMALVSEVKSRMAYPENGMNHILVSGCKSTEYSYDAYFNKPMGAMSYYATEILKASPPLTYAQFYAKLSEKLPNAQYPQSPQLEGSDVLKNSMMFE